EATRGRHRLRAGTRLPDCPAAMTPPAAAAPRRRGRKVLIVIIVLLVIAGLLFGLDRAAAAYTANRIATTLQNEGFPVKPTVSVEGFPFLTQLITRHLQGVEVTAARFPVGPVTANIDVHAQHITLDSGYQSGTIAQVRGTGLIPFASLAGLPALAGPDRAADQRRPAAHGQAQREPTGAHGVGHRPGEADGRKPDQPPHRLLQRDSRRAASPDPRSHPADTGAPAGAHRALRQGEPAGRGYRRGRKQREVRPMTGRLAAKGVVVTRGGTGIGRAVPAPP